MCLRGVRTDVLRAAGYLLYLPVERLFRWRRWLRIAITHGNAADGTMLRFNGNLCGTPWARPAGPSRKPSEPTGDANRNPQTDQQSNDFCETFHGIFHPSFHCSARQFVRHGVLAGLHGQPRQGNFVTVDPSMLWLVSFGPT